MTFPNRSLRIQEQVPRQVHPYCPIPMALIQHNFHHAFLAREPAPYSHKDAALECWDSTRSNIKDPGASSVSRKTLSFQQSSDKDGTKFRDGYNPLIIQPPTLLFRLEIGIMS